jgi:transposase-like protein
MQQKTLSLTQFQKRSGTEKACRKQLFHLRWPEGFRCPRCDHGEAYFHRTRHLYHCKACDYQASLTAGTVFHKTRTPLTKWFWMIWLMGRQKSDISMLSLQRILDIPIYKTVWSLGHKIRKTMGDRDAFYKLAGLLSLGIVLFGQPLPHCSGQPREDNHPFRLAICSAIVFCCLACAAAKHPIWAPNDHLQEMGP